MFRNATLILQQLKYTISKYISRNSFSDRCSVVKPGIFRCEVDGLSKIVALYTVSGNNTPISDLNCTDILYHVKRLLSLFSVPGCKTITYFSLQPVNIDEYISQINRRLQMKLVELELDKSNTKLRSHVERLVDIRRRVLRGVTPVDMSNVIGFICSDSPSYIETLSAIEYTIRSSMNVALKPITDPLKVFHIINFRDDKA